MISTRISFRWISITGLVLTLSGVYLSTLAPGLSWANHGADGGDFIAAAATGGVPHPTGYPTYLVLMRLFQMIPLGSLAYRTNLLSALCAVIAAVFVCLFVARLPFLTGRLNWVGGGIAALAYGLAPLVWSQAVITEVYNLQALFIAVLCYLWACRLEAKTYPSSLYDLCLGLISGLAMGNHLTTLFLLPIVFWMGGVVSRSKGPQDINRHSFFIGWRVNWGALGLRLAGFLFGLSIYILLPFWASTHPPINWGNPVTLKNFLWLVSGQLYAGRIFGVPLDIVFPRIQYWAGLLIDQFGWLGLVVGIYGLFSKQRYKMNKIYLFSGWLFFAFSIFSIGYDSYDSDVYLIPAFMGFSIWVGIGAVGLIDWAHHRRDWMGGLMGALILFGLAIPAVYHFQTVDASHDQRAESFGIKVIQVAPSQAIVFTEGDEATFALWYFHFALHLRPDMIVIAGNLLPYDWYRSTLSSTYPALILPTHPFQTWEMAVIEANSIHPICTASAQDQITFSCR